MSNITITNTSSSLQFLGGYVIESVEMKNGSELNGDAVIRLLIENEQYEIRVSIKKGKKEGVGLLVREDGTLYMRLMFVNDVCEGEVTKKNEYGNTVLRGRVEGGVEVGIWIEYDNSGQEIWRGLYRNGKRYITVKKQKGMKGFFAEVSLNGELVSVSEYDKDRLLKEGKCFECAEGHVVRECEYKSGRVVEVLREWNKGVMTEYGKNGLKVYEGRYEGNIKRGFVRNGEGTQYGDDGKSVLYAGEWKNGKREGYGSEYNESNPVYIGGWKNGLRHGKGSEYNGSNPIYIGEWKNGRRDGTGKELNENEEVVRSGKWIGGKFDGNIKRFEDGYTDDSSVFDIDCLNGITRLEIGNDCFVKVTQFVIDGLNELKSISIGWKSFELDESTGKGSKCVIMNCDQLSEINIGDQSFLYYESFELKNLACLISIRLGYRVFRKCHSIVFESKNN